MASRTEDWLLHPPSLNVNLTHTILHGCIWVGYNIDAFDCPILIKAFKDCNMPVPKALIDVYNYCKGSYTLWLKI